MIKKLIIILFGTPILFAATLGTIFGVIFYLSFNEISTETAHMVIAESDKKAARELSSYKLKTGNLKIELDQASTTIARGEQSIDSLNTELTFRTLEVNTLKNYLDESNRQMLAESQKKTSMKELAKTYDTMKPDEFRPILVNVDDNTLVSLYRNMSSRNRKNILLALSKDRAAHITQLLAGFMD